MNPGKIPSTTQGSHSVLSAHEDHTLSLDQQFVFDHPLHIMLIDPDLQAHTTLAPALHRAGHTVYITATHTVALHLLEQHQIDCILVHVDMLGVAAVSFCHRVRRYAAMPILAYGKPGASDIVIALLDAGANEYVGTPLVIPELLARLRVIARSQLPTARMRAPHIPRSSHAIIHVETAQRCIWYRQNPIRLTPTEWDVFCCLWQVRPEIVAYDHLIAHLWPNQFERTPSVLHTFVRQIRRKLGDAVIENVYGIGYRIGESIVGAEP